MGAAGLALLVPAAIAAQVRASVAVGVGTVRSSGGSRFSSASLSPLLQVESPGLFLSAGGTVASLPQGAWSGQGRLTLWTATPVILSRWRVGVEGSGSGTTRTDDRWSAAAHGVLEVLWSAPRWGIGLGTGPSAGWIADQPSVTAWHSRARLWWRRGGLGAALLAEPTRFLGGWFTDLSGGLTLGSGPVTASAWVVGRLSDRYASRTAAGASFELDLLSNLAIEAGGGSYLPEPYEGLPGTRYLTAGLRWFTPKRAAPPVRSGAVGPLRPERRGDSVAVRFRMPGARSLAIAGDWNDWQPVPLRSAGRDLWEGVLSVPPGTHRFTLLVDGTEWVVPGGVAVRELDTGGRVGIMVVD